VGWGDSVHLFGHEMQAWLFETPGTPTQIAAWFMRRHPLLRDEWVLPSATVLTGIEGGVQWVVRLEPADTARTRGALSRLVLRPAFEPSWRGCHWCIPAARLAFEMRSHADGMVVLQQVWTHTVSAGELVRALHRRLRRGGWSDGDAPQGGRGDMTMDWRRRGARLSLSVAAAQAGSTLYVHLREPAAP
jgi:hypothetical protein